MVTHDNFAGLLIAFVFAALGPVRAEAYGAHFTIKQTAIAKVGGKNRNLSLNAKINYGYDTEHGVLKISSATGTATIDGSSRYDFSSMKTKFKSDFKSFSITRKAGTITVSSVVVFSKPIDFDSPVDAKAKSGGVLPLT